MEDRGFRHEALIYADAEDLLRAAVPFLREALEAEQPAMVAVRRDNSALIEGELGEDSMWVRFADMEELGRNPARIIPFWRDFLAESGGAAVRGIGEPIWPGRGSAEVDECQRHEALLNVAFADSGTLALLCPYDEGGLGDEVLEGAAHSHPVLVHDGHSAESRGFEPGRDCFAGELPAPPPEAEELEFGRAGLAELRRRVREVADSAGLSSEDASGLVSAANELAGNSVVHGDGSGTLRLWQEPRALTVEVEDRGRIDEPLAGRVRPGATQARGRGLWLANQLCDLVQIRSGPAGTTVRLRTATDD